ncbi:MAG: pyridoxamine 5'-phosphate oxidase family protein [Clostridiales bacterium]|nr:pyridoxamine 5'-phosphate oxidase family protein [Clostridiales bacterium]
MRRKDREVTDFNTILEIIDGCEIIRLGLADGEFPYIVPVNFAYQVTDGQIAFYIHGAMAGRKYHLMQRNQKCSFEMDIPLQMECLYDKHDVTMRYQSVMGTADITLLEGEERQRAIDDIIMARHEETRHFDYNRKDVAATAVAKLTVRELTAKANPIAGGPDL